MSAEKLHHGLGHNHRLRFRQLRKIKGGNKRVAAFFKENLGKVIHREVIKGLLFEHDDYMKRVRNNGGAKDGLSRENVAILSGAYHSAAIMAFCLPKCSREEFVSTQFDEVGRKILQDAGYFDQKQG